MSTRSLKRIRILLMSAALLVLFTAASVQAHASWVQNADGTYSYYNAKGKLLTGRWIKQKYYVDSEGIRVTGRQQIGSDWYYFTAKGKLYRDRWFTKKGKKYYADKDGRLYTDGVYQIGKESYLFGPDSSMLTGMQSLGGKTYFLNQKTGQMMTDCLVQKSGKFYYFGKDGVMAIQTWVKYNGSYFYAGSSGYCLSSRWKGARYLGPDCRALSGLREIDGAYYYFDPKTCKKTVSTTMEIDGDKWKFDAAGKGEKVKEPDVPAPSPGVKVQPQYYTHPVVDDETLLSYIIYCEAGNQPYEGQLAVGYVILNRKYSNLFYEKTIREVVYASQQFNPVWDGAMERVYADPTRVTAQCRKAAKEVLNKEKRLKNGKSLYLNLDGKKTEFPFLFFMTYPSYQRLNMSSPYTKIGDHVFFTLWQQKK